MPEHPSLVWTMRRMGCVVPDLDRLDFGAVFQCGGPGCGKWYVVTMEVSDPGPYRAYGYGYKSFERVRWYHRRLKRRIAEGDTVARGAQRPARGRLRLVRAPWDRQEESEGGADA